MRTDQCQAGGRRVLRVRCGGARHSSVTHLGAGRRVALIEGGRKRWLSGLAALGFATTWIGVEVSPSTAAPDRRAIAVASPRLVYASPGHTGERPRLHGAWIGREATIGLGREASVREAAFVVDEPPTSTRIYATDRTAPFVVPRRGTQGKHPYALGVHTLRADVELASGRHIRLQVAYTVARTLNVPATVDAATLERSIASVAPGPVLVRPAPARSLGLGIW